MKLSDLLSFIENEVPLGLQENYDNSGLLVGEADTEISKALVCVDVTDEVLDEAILQSCHLVISHHPLIFSPVKKLTGSTLVEKLVLKAIRNNIALLALHTNLDNHKSGVNSILCEKIGILDPAILRPLQGKLRKLITFCPLSHEKLVRDSLFSAGAGQIGNYDSCSFITAGRGSYRPLEGSRPFIGNRHELHHEDEMKIEVIYPSYIEKQLLKALLDAHPYEEVAYDLIPLENKNNFRGAGMIGNLQEAVPPIEFLQKLKIALNLATVKYSSPVKDLVRKIAVCGGSGSFLIGDAIAAGADVFLTGDVKYHDYFLPENRLLLADIGHYESEQFTKELIFNLIKKKFPTFALQISEKDQNPVKYL